MSDYPVTRGSRSGDPHPTLRLAALTAVIAGVVLVAAAAFLLSYEGIHQIALQAGVSATLARLYPLMFDAMLIVACAATLALRSAGWGSRLYVWACLLVVLAAVAAGDALHATGVRLDGQPARAAIAIIPWVLLLMGFGIWLVMLRHWRRVRAAGAATGAAAAGRAGAATGTEASRAGAGTEASRADLAVAGGAAAAGATVSWAAGRGATPARAGAPRSGIDELMEPRAGQAPGRAPAGDSPAAGKPDAGQEQRRAAPDQKLRAPAVPAAKAGSAAASPPAGAGQNGTATAGPTTAGPAGAGSATKATGAGAAVAAGAAGAAGAAAARAAGSARTGQDESSQDGNGEDATGKEATGKEAAGKEAADKEATGKEATGKDSAGQDATGRKAAGEDGAGQEGTSKDNGSKDNGGKGEPEARDRRARLGGFREVPVSADDEEGSVKILPPKPKAPAQGAAPAKDGPAPAKDDKAPGKDSGADEAGKPGGEADRAAPTPQPMPAAALAPQFDRLRSSPTPPEDPGDRG
ncbi:MAG TPA: DUF2637 domain-containing protein [Streptosporangiaceae bacterium]|nr:DUF2637 domain-containing protein [Streptosporangiaceae bacterium]